MLVVVLVQTVVIGRPLRAVRLLVLVLHQVVLLADLCN